MVVAGLEGDINGATSRALAGIGQGHDFGVRSAEGCMIALTYELSMGVNDDRTDHGVRRGPAPAEGGESQGSIHPSMVGVVWL